ncbi:YeaH/YhbH family protein [Pseudemcibacter aquimaris]|uniref:YeaH/YhbH family protein n=1 Tax=Pseudemcibacter aquimaris TaxID=2857064 RepID=UPI00201165B7|nr:YeaH/YhbH family protein [Pseudemcibacter aquimaris]MCC3861541.1 YeaH/YhbH family protein [Pseudemcibacter aquimaris]WDU58310.1 YeaH/YhbH family protein [Pseudemcibacter aquimaris]
MMHIIDRRLNPKGKSISNRQRFLKRAKKQIKKAVNDAITNRKISNTEGEENIRIPADGLHEPRFIGDQEKGIRDRIFPGNKDFMPGDKISRPPSGGKGAGSEASEDGEGEDMFQFSLTRDEFLDIFFEDMELPDFVKTSIKNETTHELQRAGYRRSGSPSNLNLKLTMKNSLARRLCLRRPSDEELQALEADIAKVEAKKRKTDADKEMLEKLRQTLKKKSGRRRVIPYIDPLDVRFTSFNQIEKPTTHAVMFCLMDVSGSMSEVHKDLAKRFFMLLHLFLIRQYSKVDIVFIRHTHMASEVDEDTFFHSRETGGTKVSTALEVMNDIIKERYPAEDWNIYAAQASDGDNLTSDNERCQYLLQNVLLPQCQYFAYVEIWDQREEAIFNGQKSATNLWQTYDSVNMGNQNFAIKKVTGAADIFPVLKDLFSKSNAQEGK